MLATETVKGTERQLISACAHQPLDHEQYIYKIPIPRRTCAQSVRARHLPVEFVTQVRYGSGALGRGTKT